MTFMLALVLSLVTPSVAELAQQEPACLKSKLVDRNVQFTAPDGSRFSLQDYAGRRVVLSFWATWVRGSRSQLAVLDSAHDAWRKKSVDVLAVALKPESLQSIVLMQQKNQLSIKLAAAMDDSEVSKAFQITVLPSTYLIDGRGTITQCFAGVVSAAEVEKHLSLK